MTATGTASPTVIDAVPGSLRSGLAVLHVAGASEVKVSAHGWTTVESLSGDGTGRVLVVGNGTCFDLESSRLENVVLGQSRVCRALPYRAPISLALNHTHSLRSPRRRGPRGLE